MKQIYIIWGAPASGKTTYVKEHKGRGDLVVDFDLIKQSITMGKKTESAYGLYDVAEGIREYLYKRIESGDVACENVWVIASLADAAERQSLADRLGAELIHIDATYNQCVSRALQDDERTDKELQLRIIEKWFSNYRENGVYTEERWD